MLELALDYGEKALVVAHHARQLDVVADAERAPLLYVVQGVVVPAQLKLAEAEHSEGRAGLRLLARGDGESARRFRKVVCVVVERRQIPPAFGPIGAQRNPAAIESDGLLDAVAFARRRSLRRNLLKLLLRRRRHRGRGRDGALLLCARAFDTGLEVHDLLILGRFVPNWALCST